MKPVDLVRLFTFVKDDKQLAHIVLESKIRKVTLGVSYCLTPSHVRASLPR